MESFRRDCKENPDGFLIVNQDAYSRLSSSSSRAPSPPRDYHGVRQRKSGIWVAEFRQPNNFPGKILVGSFDTKKDAAEAVARKKKRVRSAIDAPYGKVELLNKSQGGMSYLVLNR